MIAALESGTKVGEDPLDDLYAEQVREQFGDDALTEIFTPLFAFLPPAGQTESWVRKWHTSKDHPRTTINKFRIAKRDPYVTAIDLEAEIVPNERGEFLKFGPSTVHFDLRGTQKGELRVDTASGLIREGRWVADIRGSQTAKTPNGEQRTEVSARLTTSVQRLSP
jgi:hypothetical protein